MCFARSIVILFRESSLFNSREAIAAIKDIVVFYNSKNLNRIGALSFFRSVHTFSCFLKSNWSSDFGHAETGNERKGEWSIRVLSFLFRILILLKLLGLSPYRAYVSHKSDSPNLTQKV